MRLDDGPVMRVLVMLVVDVGMLVLDGVVGVLVRVFFAHEEPDARGHEDRGCLLYTSPSPRDS